jgi:phosphatidylglycerophosphatase A
MVAWVIMAIKESSDELNPAVAVPPSEIAPRKQRTAGDYVALAIATCGVGYLPIAPGTWGSAVGVGIYLLLRLGTTKLVSQLFPTYSPMTTHDPRDQFIAIQLVCITAISLIGIWAATRAERIFQRKDPGQVVIDEVAGQLIALLPVPLMAGNRWPWLTALAFVLFRVFDIIKPYPARRFEDLESGLGIVADDLVAGAYAAVVVSVALSASGIFS